MALGRLKDEVDLENFLREMLDRLGVRPSSLRLPTYTMATLPPATTANAGMPVYVSDAAAGSKYQGSDGSAWVSLG
jgi:hypothetical protein